MRSGDDLTMHELASNLATYKDQLNQVRKFLVDEPGNSEYADMEKELEEVISLTEELLATARNAGVCAELDEDVLSTERQPNMASQYIMGDSGSHEKFSVGTKVQAVYSEDGEWYIATIEALTPNGYYVHYDDWGNREEVDPSNVRAIQAEVNPLLEAEKDAEATKQAIKRKIAQAATVDFQSHTLPAKLRIEPDDSEDVSSLPLALQTPNKTLYFPIQHNHNFSYRLPFRDIIRLQSRRSLFSFSSTISSSSRKRIGSVSSTNLSSVPPKTRNYEFYDADTEVELRLDIGALDIESSKDVFLDTDETSLLIRVKASGRLMTLMESNVLFDRIKPSETIWYIDEDQLVINLKKYDRELKWPDIMESWESLKSGVLQLLKGTSIYIIGNSTEMNQEVARELAVGLGYTPINTSELLERYAQQSIGSWLISEGADSVAEAEITVFEGLSSHVRTVVATLGGNHGAATRHDKWRHLHAGFSVWLSKTEATDEAFAKEEARMSVEAGNVAYSNADVVVKFSGWETGHTTVVAQACLSALKQLILSDKELAGKKSLYIRLGCRGDWPNIKPPGWDPSSEADPSS